MVGAWLVVALPSAVGLFVVGWVPAVVGAVLIAPIWIWSQIDIRRELGTGWSPLLPTWSEMWAAMQGRDRFYPDDPLRSHPERPG